MKIEDAINDFGFQLKLNYLGYQLCHNPECVAIKRTGKNKFYYIDSEERFQIWVCDKCYKTMTDKQKKKLVREVQHV